MHAGAGSYRGPRWTATSRATARGATKPRRSCTDKSSLTWRRAVGCGGAVSAMSDDIEVAPPAEAPASLGDSRPPKSTSVRAAQQVLLDKITETPAAVPSSP